MIYETALQGKCAAFNRAHAEANRLVPIIQEALRPFIGQKVALASGGLTKKVKSALPAMPNGPDLSAYLRSTLGGYSLVLEVRANELSKGRLQPGDTNANYAETCVHIGDFAHSAAGVFATVFATGDLGKFYNFTPLRTDYTPAEVVAKREALRKAKDALSKAKADLYPFSEYDI